MAICQLKRCNESLRVGRYQNATFVEIATRRLSLNFRRNISKKQKTPKKIGRDIQFIAVLTFAKLANTHRASEV
jgi:hypothetical protein